MLDITGEAVFQTDELQVVADTGNEASLTIEEGLLTTNRFIVQATGEGEADVSLAGGRVETSTFVVRSSGTGIASAFISGTVVADTITMESTDDGDSQIVQFGGSVTTSRIRTDGDFSNYLLAGGSLNPTNGGALTIESDLNLTELGELVLSGTELATITGSLNSVSFDFGGAGEALLLAATEEESRRTQGIINALAPELMINPDLFINEAGYVPLIHVGNTSNLASGEAFDDILLLTNLPGARFDELDFFGNLQPGGTAGFFFSLVPGERFGQSGTVGVTFANFVAVPEPSSIVLLTLSCMSLTSRRRRSLPQE